MEIITVVITISKIVCLLRLMFSIEFFINLTIPFLFSLATTISHNIVNNYMAGNLIDHLPYKIDNTNTLFKLANKISSLYFLVLVLWFYLVLYVFNCPKSIGCTEWCYQFVITIVLSTITLYKISF